MLHGLHHGLTAVQRPRLGSGPGLLLSPSCVRPCRLSRSRKALAVSSAQGEGQFRPPQLPSPHVAWALRLAAGAAVLLPLAGSFLLPQAAHAARRSAAPPAQQPAEALIDSSTGLARQRLYARGQWSQDQLAWVHRFYAGGKAQAAPQAAKPAPAAAAQSAATPAGPSTSPLSDPVVQRVAAGLTLAAVALLFLRAAQLRQAADEGAAGEGEGTGGAPGVGSFLTSMPSPEEGPSELQRRRRQLSEAERAALVAEAQQRIDRAKQAMALAQQAQQELAAVAAAAAASEVAEAAAEASAGAEQGAAELQAAELALLEAQEAAAELAVQLEASPPREGADLARAPAGAELAGDGESAGAESGVGAGTQGLGSVLASRGAEGPALAVMAVLSAAAQELAPLFKARPVSASPQPGPGQPQAAARLPGAGRQLAAGSARAPWAATAPGRAPAAPAGAKGGAAGSGASSSSAGGWDPVSLLLAPVAPLVADLYKRDPLPSEAPGGKKYEMVISLLEAAVQKPAGQACAPPKFDPVFDLLHDGEVGPRLRAVRNLVGSMGEQVAAAGDRLEPVRKMLEDVGLGQATQEAKDAVMSFVDQVKHQAEVVIEQQQQWQQQGEEQAAATAAAAAEVAGEAAVGQQGQEGEVQAAPVAAAEPEEEAGEVQWDLAAARWEEVPANTFQQQAAAEAAAAAAAAAAARAAAAEAEQQQWEGAVEMWGGKLPLVAAEQALEGSSNEQAAPASDVAAADESNGPESQNGASPAPSAAAAVEAAPPVPTPTQLLRLVAAGAILPHPSKAATGGEDAFFASGQGLGAAGVADGVGGWAQQGLNPAEYPRQLLAACEEGLGEHEDPLSLLQYAHECAEAPGSCTVCLAAMQSEGQLRVVSLGDCNVAVIRGGKEVVFQAEVQEHQFNQPLQMASPRFMPGGSQPEQALQYQVEVEEGDVVVLASDGLWDNLWEEEIVAAVQGRLQELQLAADAAALERAAAALAAELAQRAQQRSEDPSYLSPFAVERHKKETPALLRQFMQPRPGGKPDDITVVVGVLALQPAAVGAGSGWQGVGPAAVAAVAAQDPVPVGSS